MDMTQQPTDVQKRIRKVAYWQPNQLAVTHHSLLDITAGKRAIIASLDLETLGHTLFTVFGYQLTSFTSSDVPHHHRPDRDGDGHDDHDHDHDEDNNVQRGQYLFLQQEGDTAVGPDSLQSPVGKYVFPHPTGEGTLVLSFFHVHGKSDKPGSDSTINAVDIINKATGDFGKSPTSRLVAAMPNWYHAGTNNDPQIIIQGCPVTPPIPVADTCVSGSWHYILPAELPDFIQDASGAGVAVFVLDTLPTLQQISQAVNNSGGNNTLLLDFAENVTLNYQVLSDALDIPHSGQPSTGNDIYEELVGFPMNDHGVFIAGIIRDIAPGAQVECIRVLNDYCVGDTTTLINALSLIQSRLLPGGDLQNTPVVVNMSLTATPSEEGLAGLGFTDVSIAPARIGLLLLMQTLGQQGVVFAASSGNGSGPHDKITNPPGERVQPRFPAAFAYPLPGAVLAYPDLPAMIPVGAVDSLGAAASYSNYPGPLGIGTYGGVIPQPGKYDPVTGTQAQLIDAPCGIYTSALYPALSKHDLLPIHSPAPVSYPEYEPSPAVTWAYWSGTSFATPVISALAARVMETQPSVGDSVRQTLLNAAPAQVDWTNLDTGQSDACGPLIMVGQECTIGELE